MCSPFGVKGKDIGLPLRIEFNKMINIIFFLSSVTVNKFVKGI